MISFNGTVADITERKTSEEKLGESELKFRALADTMPQFVWSTGADGQIDYLNRKFYEFTGMPDVVGNDTWTPITHPDDLPGASERWAASIRSGEEYESELRLFDRRKHAYRWYLVRTVPVRDGAGQIRRWSHQLRKLRIKALARRIAQA